MRKPSRVAHLRLPVVTAGSELLVMGYLMRRNILAYKAPQNNEGYDLICIHPDPRHKPAGDELAQVRVQVKSRYASDCDQKIPLKGDSLDAFDFLVVSMLNIGDFYRKSIRPDADHNPVFYTFPVAFVREHHHQTAGWKGELALKKLIGRLAGFEGESGFELIAKALGVPYPKKRDLAESEAV